MLVGKQFGPFTVEDELGSGSMGTVYLARMERKGRLIPVALTSDRVDQYAWRRRDLFERLYDHLLHGVIGHGVRCTGTRLAVQPSPLSRA